MKMARYAGMALLVVTPAAAADLLYHARAGNRVLLQLDAGTGEVEFLTPSAFRFRQVFTGKLPELTREPRLTIPFKMEEAAGELTFVTRYIRVSVRKTGVRVVVRKLDGTRVFEDLAVPEYSGGAVRVVRAAPWEAALYGLGARTAPNLNARGSVVRAGVPFVYSSAGYGEYHTAPAAYTFDALHSDRYLVEARGAGLLDYYFCYGPTPKEVFEELQTSGVSITVPPLTPAEPAWAGLRAAVLRLLHASFSGLMAPAFDAGAFSGADAELRRSATDLAALVNAGSRKDLGPYWFAYQQEVRDRGIPPIRPLPVQFPADAEAAEHTSEFMFGDELLVSPQLSPGDRRGVYLPMGIWTRLDTNEVFKGRQTIDIAGGTLALFARNGSIVPLQSDVLELHYFPNLGGEFFLFEDESGDYTQVHAAPAADIMRLEIESAREREYEWVVRHANRPRAVGFEGRPFQQVTRRASLAHEKWFFDETSHNLHVRVKVAAGEDRIVNLSF
jgi:alpha-glucosidase (family GH31 glycosyl hydrolase)